MQYTQKQLENFLSKAWSYENRAEWGVENLPTEFVGTVKRERGFYDIYVDESKRYWYMVRIMTERGIVSEYEAVFGHPERKGWRYRKR